jgi:hypothetical protein
VAYDPCFALMLVLDRPSRVPPPGGIQFDPAAGGPQSDYAIVSIVRERGNVNEIVHMWGYTDLADRTKRRAAMAADPAWQAYLQKSREYMKTMNNKILVPTTFSPTK